MDVVCSSHSAEQIRQIQALEYTSPYHSDNNRVISIFAEGNTWRILSRVPDQHGYIPIEMKRNGAIRYIRSEDLKRYSVLKVFKQVD